MKIPKMACVGLVGITMAMHSQSALKTIENSLYSFKNGALVLNCCQHKGIAGKDYCAVLRMKPIFPADVGKIIVMSVRSQKKGDTTTYAALGYDVIESQDGIEVQYDNLAKSDTPHSYSLHCARIAGYDNNGNPQIQSVACRDVLAVDEVKKPQLCTEIKPKSGKELANTLNLRFNATGYPMAEDTFMELFNALHKAGKLARYTLREINDAGGAPLSLDKKIKIAVEKISSENKNLLRKRIAELKGKKETEAKLAEHNDIIVLVGKEVEPEIRLGVIKEIMNEAPNTNANTQAKQ